MVHAPKKSTQVEILLGYLTSQRGYYRNIIYTSRNSFRLLNISVTVLSTLSTQVEILLGYLTVHP